MYLHHFLFPVKYSIKNDHDYDAYNYVKYYSYRVKRIAENFYKLSSVCKKITLEMFPSQLDVLFTIVTIHENFPLLNSL